MSPVQNKANVPVPPRVKLSRNVPTYVRKQRANL